MCQVEGLQKAMKKSAWEKVEAILVSETNNPKQMNYKEIIHLSYNCFIPLL